MEVNLRPADYVGRRVFYLPRFLKLFLVVSYLLALVVLPGGQFLLNGQLEAETRALSATLESGRAEAERISAVLDAGNRLSANHARLEEQLTLRYHWSATLRELEQVAAAAAVTVTGFFRQQEQADLHARASALREAGRWPEVVEKSASFAEARLQAIEKVEDSFLVLMTAKVVRGAVMPPAAALPDGRPPSVPANDKPLPPRQPEETTPPPAVVEPEEPPDAAPEEYIVRRNDSLTKIALRFGFTLEALLAANPQIKNPRLIFPGQRILLPAAD